MTIHEFLENEKFVNTMHDSLKKIIKFILSEDIPFGILVNILHVKFEPKLPKEIKDSFKTLTLFELYGYTLSSATLENEILIFEAGFGEDDFASIVSVPLGSIVQITLDGTPIFLNMSIPKLDEEKIIEKKDVSQKKNNAKRSMEALLKNPENKNLVKK